MSISLLTVNLLIKLFLFLWIIHDVFRLVPLHFCEGNLINCGNAYVSIYQHVFITWPFVFVSLKKKDYRFLIGGLGIMSILKKKTRKIPWVGLRSVSKFEIGDGLPTIPFDQRGIFIELNQTGIRDLGFHVLTLSSKIKKSATFSADADTKVIYCCSGQQSNHRPFAYRGNYSI